MYKLLLVYIFLFFVPVFQYDNQGINQRIVDYIELTDKEFKALIESSNIGFMEVFQKNPLDVNTDGEFTYLLFGKVPNSVEGLQYRYNNIFKVEKQEIVIEEENSIEIVHKLIYKNSFLKVFFNSVKNTDDIVSGKIENKEIALALDIHVGMSKKDFFNKIFANGINVDFHALDTFQNMNFIGEIKQKLVFKEDTLNKVILTSDYDWIPFEL